MKEAITPATFNGKIIYRSTPLTVEDLGAQRMPGGDMLKKWKVRLMDGTVGTCWTSADADCPFVKGVNRWYTREEKSYGIKIMPYDAKAESDKDRRITRMAVLNTAATMISLGYGAEHGGATLENITGLATKLLEWVEQ